MPRIKSAKKALRQSIRRRSQNLERKNRMKTVIKQFKKLAAGGQFEEAKKYLPRVYKTIDKMAKVNLIKHGKASRLKSRLAKKLRQNKVG